ncbi:MAG: SET domain-containing protein-lysine N-methyltransferase [Myxococcales bacterium]|nr:SET domain-containing protein-lysine N-methyltransferase [Myxococcales bacterium]MBK7196809.1 SET domain-containing protein-lysine N-methyltransferase [Myxococcales bacterium]MBP6844832.1 SET domain-containing protein-lysine N-methyltransferase [Kofleriaceae bacterium]
MPHLTGLRVTHSAIHGYGVITTRRFAKGELVLEGDGVLYREDDEFDDTYALVLPGWGADGGDDPDAPAVYYDLIDQTRWINHSCEPNTEIDSRYDHERGALRAWWVATRDLEPGEELTYDYAFVGALAQPCACGAAACRGLIVDADPEELAAVPEELRGHLRLAAGRAA